MQRLTTTSLSLLILVFALISDAVAIGDQEAKMREVIDVLEAINRIPENSIPPALLRNAKGIAIIPSVVKVGLVIGGRYGKGVVTVRKADGSWSNPLFLSVSGGSVGWQVGAQSTDVILVFKTRKSIDDIINGKFTLGADASVAAGPVGRMASAATDIKMGSEIYSYSRSRGLFVGITLDGARLSIEQKDNASYYRNKSLQPAQILAGDHIAAPASTGRLRDILNRFAK
jgi:lipid-binding SYLF domain-containing protein